MNTKNIRTVSILVLTAAFLIAVGPPVILAQDDSSDSGSFTSQPLQLQQSPAQSSDQSNPSNDNFNNYNTLQLQQNGANSETQTGNPAMTETQTGNPVTTETQTGNSQITPLQNPLNVNSVGSLLGTFVDVISYLLVLFAVLALLWTGLQYILARGNPAKMTEQSHRLLWIVIGVAIVIGARIIIQVVINTLSATGTVNQSTLTSVNQALNGQ